MYTLIDHKNSGQFQFLNLLNHFYKSISGSKALEMTSVNAHMNVFTPLSHLATFLSPLYLSPHHAPTCLAYSAPSSLHPLPLSLHSPIHSLQLCWQLLSHSTGNWEAFILHTALKTLPAGSYCFGAPGEKGRQIDRKADRQWKWKMHSAKNTKPWKHNSNIRDINILCSHNHYCVCLFFSVYVFVCALSSVWSYFSEGDVRAWARSTETI